MFSDAEDLAADRAEMEAEMLDTAYVYETVAPAGTAVGGVSDGAGGLVRQKPGATIPSVGTTSRQRTYKCRVTVPSSHNQKQEDTETTTSDTLTMVLIVLPWNAIVQKTSFIEVVNHETKVRTKYQVTQTEPHSEAISFHAYAVQLGL